jgi:D-3-phosphoglycerate dehydrogenase
MFGIRVEAELEGEMIYIVNEDAPGFIGRLGTAARRGGSQYRHLQPRPTQGGGRGGGPGLSVDSPVGPELVKRLAALPGVKRVEPLRF